MSATQTFPHWLGAVAALACTSAFGQSVLYVDDDAPPGGDGLSWESVFDDLQLGLAAARGSGGVVEEIRVGQGVYYPTDDPFDMYSVFDLVPGVVHLGGFAGYGANNPDARDPVAFPTVLDARCWSRVARLSHAEPTTVLDGLVLANGRTIHEPPDGVELKMVDARPLIRNCVFRSSCFEQGVVADEDSDPTFLDCYFGVRSGLRVSSAHLSNCIFESTKIYAVRALALNCLFTGTNLQMSVRGTAEFVGCEFRDLLMEYTAWLIQVDGADADVRFEDCMFQRIRTPDARGELLKVNEGANVQLIDSVMQGNDALAVHVESAGTATLTNCLFSDNHSRAFAAIAYVEWGTLDVSHTTIAYNSTSWLRSIVHMNGVDESPPIRNCILWENRDLANGNLLDPTSGCCVFLEYSCKQGGWEGEGDIEADPRFIDPDGPDDIPGTADDDFRLAPGSPCIDAGSNAGLPADVADLDGDGDFDEPLPLDFDGNPRRIDDPWTPDTGEGEAPIVDMGAYEAPAAPCPADFNGDFTLNLFDFLAFQSAFGNEDESADLAPPFGVLNLFDFLAFQTLFGTGC